MVIKSANINNLLETKQIDSLIQEWSANKRQTVTDQDSITFPKRFFPNYSVHFHSTECAVLYHNGLCVTPLPPQPNYVKPTHQNNFHICGIILHSQTTDYGIYSVYRTQTADPCQIFSYQWETDHIIIGGDFNIHHPFWGSNKANSISNEFLDTLTQSNLQILNSPTPTRLDPRFKTLSCIDLTLTSHNIPLPNWQVDQIHHDPDISDHFHIYITIPLKTNYDEMIYHTTWNLSSNTKWKKYHKDLSESIKSYSPSNNPTTHATEITSMIYNTAISTISFRKFIKRTNRGSTENSKPYKKQLNA